MTKFSEKINRDILFVLVVFIVFASSLFMHDDILSVISGTFGIIYTILAGKRKIICFIFGITGTVCGALISYKTGFWGSSALHFFYYLPMMVTGFFNWRRHIQNDTKEVIKERLNKRSLFVYSLLCVILCIGTCFLFYQIGDKSPVLDSLVTVLSLFGMFLTVGRYTEQWVVWIIVDVLLILMWFLAVKSGEHAVAVLISRFIYLILGIYFLKKWREDK